jgi:hypothetical protein
MYNYLLTFIGLFFSICTPIYIDQLYLSQGHDPSIMTISFVSNISNINKISYGLISTNLNNTFYLNSYHISPLQYTFDYPNYPTYTSDYIYHITLTNLKPSSVYYYEIGCNKYNFTTLGSIKQNKSTIFGVIGDLGQTQNSKQTLENMSKDSFIEMILNVGDLSYADCNQTKWDTFGRLITKLANHIPWMIAPGNHEIEYINSTTPFYVAYENRFKMPQIQKAEIDFNFMSNTNLLSIIKNQKCTPSEYISSYNYGNSFYSFNAGLSYIIVLNPYTQTNHESKQYKWLECELNKIDRKTYPWLIVLMHCPFYNSNIYHQNEIQTINMSKSMEKILYDYKTNIIFSGHVHAYERTYPIYNNKINKNGPIYIVIGTGGNSEGHYTNYLNKPEWSAYRNGLEYGYGKLEIFNKTTSKWSFIINDENNKSSNKILDEIIINNFTPLDI